MCEKMKRSYWMYLDVENDRASKGGDGFSMNSRFRKRVGNNSFVNTKERINKHSFTMIHNLGRPNSCTTTNFYGTGRVSPS